MHATANLAIANNNSNASVDADEVSHFNGLASSWWDPHGPSRLLHLMNPLRHSFISSCISSQQDATSNTTNLTFLDVGCGGGIFAESAARLQNTAMVTAVDPSSDVLAVAKQHAKRDPTLLGKLKYLNIGIEDLTTDVQTGHAPGFDVVTLFEVLEHVTNPSEFLSLLSVHVKPGGWLVLSTISRTWTSWLVTKLMAENVLGIVPVGTHDWQKYVNESEIRQWFDQQGGWTNPRTMGVAYIPTLGWTEVRGGEDYGNYFFAVRKAAAEISV